MPVIGQLRLLFIENESFKTILATDIDCLPEFECKTILLQTKHNSDTELGRIELELVQNLLPEKWPSYNMRCYERLTRIEKNQSSQVVSSSHHTNYWTGMIFAWFSRDTFNSG